VPRIGRRFRSCRLPAATAAGLIVIAGATASGSTIPVTLKLVGAPNRDLGQAARLTATARLPAGSRLLIRRFSGRSHVKIAECLRSPCTGLYRNARTAQVRFQALAIRRSGARTTILGRSRQVTVSWAPVATTPPSTPPPTSPPAGVTPGHYEGKTADNEAFRFDVSADGTGLSNLQTGQINESCDPPAYLSGGNLAGPGPFPIAPDGTFSIKQTLSGTVSGSMSTINALITGRLSGGTASGTYRVDTTFTLANGTGYNCSSGDQAWTATRTG
jgi:hypothetical protein